MDCEENGGDRVFISSKDKNSAEKTVKHDSKCGPEGYADHPDTFMDCSGNTCVNEDPSFSAQDGQQMIIDDGKEASSNVPVRYAVNQVECSTESNDFFSTLDLLPRKRARELVHDGCLLNDGPCKKQHQDSELARNDEQLSVPAVPEHSFLKLFKSDPKQLMDLLSQALSTDTLSDLLKQEHGSSSTKLKQLKDKLEKAQHTLEHCNQRKTQLQEKIDVVTTQISEKRMQLESIREELSELSMQEGELKSRRIEADKNCSEIRRKLYASREALQQIQKLFGKRSRSSVQKEVTEN